MRLDLLLVKARKCVRKMRGGAQAHLIESDGGDHYVVKFANNPQGRRILVNEFVSSLLLGELGIAVPQPAVVAIDEEFLRSNPEVCLSLGNEQIAVRPGVHYGSQYAVSCVGSPIYDFLPDSMLSEVFNRNHFLGALVADKWLANGDGRQAVFYRARIMGLSPAPSPVRWVAQMIDHGHAFQGSGWTFRDSPIQGLHARRVVYGSDPSIRDFAPWIDALMRVSRDFLDKVFLLIPPDWIAGEELEFLRVLRRLYQRRERVPQLLAESIDHLTKSNLAQPRESRCSS